MQERPNISTDDQQPIHPHLLVPWHLLTNSQKAQLLLNSARFLDREWFLEEYKSIEEPSLAEREISLNNPKTEMKLQATSLRHIKIDQLMLQALINLKLKQ